MRGIGTRFAFSILLVCCAFYEGYNTDVWLDYKGEFHGGVALVSLVVVYCVIVIVNADE